MKMIINSYIVEVALIESDNKMKVGGQK